MIPEQLWGRMQVLKINQGGLGFLLNRWHLLPELSIEKEGFFFLPDWKVSPTPQKVLLIDSSTLPATLRSKQIKGPGSVWPSTCTRSGRVSRSGGC